MLPNQVSGNTPDYVPEGREHLYPGAGTGEHNLGYVPDHRAQPEKRPTPMQERYGWGYQPGDELKGPLRIRADAGTMNPSPEIREPERPAAEVAPPVSVSLLVQPEEWEPSEPETAEPPSPPARPVVMLPAMLPPKRIGRPPKPR